MQTNNWANALRAQLYQNNKLQNIRKYTPNSHKTKYKVTNNSKENFRNNQLKTQTQNVMNQSKSEDSTHHQPYPEIRSPSPILQTKITKTYNSLLQIPIPARPQIIKQLYLSHNRIKSVKDKLRHFVNLRNLNLSYNCLSDVHQFINQIVDGQQFQIAQPNQHKNKYLPKAKESQYQDGDIKVSQNLIKLKILSVRMNQFRYGYQDDIVKAFDTLQKFQDFQFVNKYSNSHKQKNKISNKNKPQFPQQLFYLASRLSQYFLPAYLNIAKSISFLTKLYKIVSQSASFRSVQQISTILQQKFQQKVIKLSTLIEPPKQIKYMPCSRMQALQKVLKFVMIGIEIETDISFFRYTAQKNIINSHTDFATQNRNMFLQVLRQILIKFTMRNNYELIRTLRMSFNFKNNNQLSFSNKNNKVNQLNNQTGLDDIRGLADTFGSLFNARRHTVFQPNTAKYIYKINSKQITQHPYLQYINYNINNINNTAHQNNSQIQPLFITNQFQINNDTINVQEQLAINRDALGNLNTLDGNRKRCKNTIIRNLNQFQNQDYSKDRKIVKEQGQVKNQVQYCEKDNNLYEKFPIIIFQPNYLDILYTIMSQKTRQLIKIYDMLQQSLIHANHQNHTNKFVAKENTPIQIRDNSRDRKYQVLDSGAYLQLQDKEQPFNINRSNNNKKINIRYNQKQMGIQDKQDSTDSLDRIHIKNKNNFNKIKQQNPKYHQIPKNTNQQIRVKSMQNSNVYLTNSNKNNHQNIKTVLKNYQSKQTQHNNNIIQQQSGTNYQNFRVTEVRQKKNRQKTIQNKSNPVLQYNYKQNLSKYTIYQINLAYKVLTALKKHKNKSKKKKNKKLLQQVRHQS